MANGLWEMGKLCKDQEKRNEKKRHEYPEEEEEERGCRVSCIEKV